MPSEPKRPDFSATNVGGARVAPGKPLVPAQSRSVLIPIGSGRQQQSPGCADLVRLHTGLRNHCCYYRVALLSDKIILAGRKPVTHLHRREMLRIMAGGAAIAAAGLALMPIAAESTPLTVGRARPAAPESPIEEAVVRVRRRRRRVCWWRRGRKICRWRRF